MKQNKFADLKKDEIKEIIELEEKLNVTLLAYDVYSHQNMDEYNVDPDIINPS